MARSVLTGLKITAHGGAWFRPDQASDWWIVGVLASIAVPQYQDYIARAEASSGLATVTGYKTEIDQQIYTQGIAHADVELNDGDDIKTELGDISLDEDGDLELVFTFTSGVHASDDGTITWTRAKDDGSWSCATDDLDDSVDGDLRGCDSND